MKENKISIIVAWLLGLFLAGGVVSLLQAAPSQPQSGDVSGMVAYVGTITDTQDIYVSAHLNLNDEPQAVTQVMGPSSAYTLSVANGSYYILAYLDRNGGGGKPDADEPMGAYDGDGDGVPDLVTITDNSLTGIDLTIYDTFLQGTAVYRGGVSGDFPLEVFLQTVINQEPERTVHLAAPGGAYMLSAAPGTYYAGVWADFNNSSGAPDPGETIAYYDPNGDGVPDPITLLTDTMTLDFELGGIIYVDAAATGANTGDSWEDAYTDLNDALATAVPNQEIWVAAGTYYPGATRDDAFSLVDGVAVYGGFTGDETARRQRDYAHNFTILSGDIGVAGTATDNSYHVVTADSVGETAVLDGVVISGGYANGADPREKGGGLYNMYGSPTLANIRFISNYAENHGGAIANVYTGANPLIINCQFSGNNSFNGSVMNLNGADPTIVNSTFVGNSGNKGGIVNLYSSHANVYNTILWNNPTPIYLYQSTISVTYSIVEGGYVGDGNLDSDPLFVDADGADDIYGTLDDDLRIQPSSPAIDAGDNAALPADNGDLDGDGDFAESIPLDSGVNTRRVDDTATADSGSGVSPLVDIGADEYLALVIPSGDDVVLDGELVTGGLLDIQGGVLSGEGTVVGDVQNGGLLAPGASPGTIVIQGNYTQTLSGTLEIELALNGVPPEADQFTVNGNAALAGTLEVVITDGYEPAVGETFKVMSYTNHSGAFTTLNLPQLPDKAWATAYEADGVYITVTATEVYAIYLPMIVK